MKKPGKGTRVAAKYQMFSREKIEQGRKKTYGKNSKGRGEWKANQNPKNLRSTTWQEDPHNPRKNEQGNTMGKLTNHQTL